MNSGSAATPLTTISIETGAHRLLIDIKREDMGEFGSIKGRVAAALVADGLQKNPGARHFVESSSGNLAVAMARICSGMGLRFTAVVDPRTPKALVSEILGSGGAIEMVDCIDSEGNYLSERIRLASKIGADQGAWWPNQYENFTNPLTHFTTLAPEVFEPARGPVAAVFVAVSTGGTARGIYDYSRIHSPRTRVVAVDVEGSRALGAEAGPRMVTGIGSTRESTFLRGLTGIERVWVTEEEAVSEMVQFNLDAGIALGVSAGALLRAAINQSFELSGTGGRIVCVAADGGTPYTELHGAFDSRRLGPRRYSLIWDGRAHPN
ncbi:pyridoxal-phosphate dependent enzyme [Streptomyces sp. NPDC059668]|uniref:pyridoxal-phosphate dependent enzyme n=1 Tax=Streptomyces sp. NPDC059668 TaxID=3346900 RepID=UPI003675407C